MASSIAVLFNKIAKDYDRFNHLLSMNIDKGWRKKALKNHITNQTEHVLDIACGTADFSMQLVKVGAHKVTGIDISENMLEVGRKKVNAAHLDNQISLNLGDVADLSFADNTFDAVTVAFGVRNFEKRAQGLSEMFRVLKTGGEVIILEFSQPKYFPVKQLYGFYFKKILPWVGEKMTGDRAAFQYLPNSVYKFPQGRLFLDEMKQAGFENLSSRRFTLGIASVYYGRK